MACGGVDIAKSFLKERYDIDIDWALESNPGSKSWAQIQTLSFNDCDISGSVRHPISTLQNQETGIPLL